MSSVSEVSFGARVANAAKIRDNVKTLSNYNPPRSTESVAEYSNLISAADAANTAISVAIDNYNASTQARQKAFRTDDNSIIKLLSPIYNTLVANYGKDSREAIHVLSKINNIRASKSIKKIGPNGDPQSISQSEQSYGSLSQLFKNLIATLGNYDRYTPNRPELKMNALLALANSLDGLNQAVNDSLNILRDKRIIRNDLYSDLKERTIRIKAYLSAEYGTKSIEYKSISGLKV